jgi:hypothetical protein
VLPRWLHRLRIYVDLVYAQITELSIKSVCLVLYVKASPDGCLEVLVTLHSQWGVQLKFLFVVPKKKHQKKKIIELSFL